ncbi:MAG: DUF493 domain-containing protein [Pirellulales bacterium]
MSDPQAERQHRLDLLNATHQFPTRVTIKVIGDNRATFLDEVVAEIRIEMTVDEMPPYVVREARGGRHIAITLEPHLDDAERVLAVYARLQRIQGVVLLL